MCIPGEKKCDGIEDCTDGYDEDQCGKRINFIFMFFIKWYRNVNLNVRTFRRYFAIITQINLTF